jgi:hypothetical protein
MPLAIIDRISLIVKGCPNHVIFDMDFMRIRMLTTLAHVLQRCNPVGTDTSCAHLRFNPQSTQVRCIVLNNADYNQPT